MRQNRGKSLRLEAPCAVPPSWIGNKDASPARAGSSVNEERPRAEVDGRAQVVPWARHCADPACGLQDPARPSNQSAPHCRVKNPSGVLERGRLKPARGRIDRTRLRAMRPRAGAIADGASHGHEVGRQGTDGRQIFQAQGAGQDNQQAGLPCLPHERCQATDGEMMEQAATCF